MTVAHAAPARFVLGPITRSWLLWTFHISLLSAIAAVAGVPYLETDRYQVVQTVTFDNTWTVWVFMGVNAVWALRALKTDSHFCAVVALSMFMGWNGLFALSLFEKFLSGPAGGLEIMLTYLTGAAVSAWILRKGL